MGALSPVVALSGGEQQLPPSLPETVAWTKGQGLEATTTQKSLSVVKEFDTWPYRDLFMRNHSGGLWSHLEPLSEALHPLTQVEYGPRGMVFNINSPLTISIKTKNTLNHETASAMVFLNGRNITSQSDVQFIGKNQLTLKFTSTFFNKNKNYNLVTFFRENNSQPWQYKIYQESTCSLKNTKNKNYRPTENQGNGSRTLASTLTQTMSRFENIIRPSELLHELELESEKGKINPALVYGLIMQESGFDPKAFSKARALGLSQMTRRAAVTVMPTNEEWPLLEKIDTMPWFEVKLGLLSGEIDEVHDWRLIPKSSLRGGISYLKYLTQFWEKELELSTNASHLPTELLDMIHRDAWTIRDKSSVEYRDLILTQLVLASYNMGPNRVRQFAQYHKDERNRYLQGIRGYLRGIKSYCQLASE